MVEGRDLPQGEHAQLSLYKRVMRDWKVAKCQFQWVNTNATPKVTLVQVGVGNPMYMKVGKWNMHRHLAIVGIQHKKNLIKLMQSQLGVRYYKPTFNIMAYNQGIWNNLLN
jgi:hypothetical protein